MVVVKVLKLGGLPQRGIDALRGLGGTGRRAYELRVDAEGLTRLGVSLARKRANICRLGGPKGTRGRQADSVKKVRDGRGELIRRLFRV